VHGWFTDPFVLKRGDTCPEVVTSVDGKPPTRFDVCESMTPRPDVEQVTHLPSFELRGGAYHLSKGRHSVCVDVVPYRAAAPDQLRACKDVDVEWDQFSQGVIDTAVVSNGVLTAQGWFSQVRDTSAAYSFHPAWYLDGTWIRSQTNGITLTAVDRPDVAAAIGPTGAGSQITAPVQPGSHTICIGLDDGFGGWGPPNICKTVVAP
jgi:hypothetical protein